MRLQAALRARFGFERVPVVTGIVFALTAAGAIAQAVVPGLLGSLQRTPEGLHGDWWRTGTALFGQDGGVVGALSNLAFLLILGAIAEQFLAAWQWLACYFGAGLAGELAGYAWQPVGAGNSIAVCGLAGALVVALWARTPAIGPAAPLFCSIGAARCSARCGGRRCSRAWRAARLPRPRGRAASTRAGPRQGRRS